MIYRSLEYYERQLLAETTSDSYYRSKRNSWSLQATAAEASDSHWSKRNSCWSLRALVGAYEQPLEPTSDSYCSLRAQY